MGNIKKFNEMKENFVATEEFIIDAQEAFRDLMDRETEPIPFNKETDRYFEIFITMTPVRKYRTVLNVNTIISEYEKEIDVLRDIEVAIKRLHDVYKVYPLYEEEDGEDNWFICLIYDSRINYPGGRTMYAD